MAESPLLEETRENWGTRAGFVLAAIGSAVGLGNLWGFPYKLYKYGGGAFLIPYIAAMLVIGIPVLILEFSLGHMTQRAAPDAFRKTGRAKEPVGWWGILLGFVIITYYPVILAWCLSFLYYSLDGIIHHGGELAWAKTQDGAQNFFLYDYANLWQAGETAHAWLPGGISPEIVFSLGIVWLLMYLCIFRGVKMVSKVVLFTVPLPWLMLVLLTFRGLTLPGAQRGLAYYLNPDFNQLLEPTTWRFAFGQVFFSMSLAFGVMITYASFLHRKSDINNNAAIIGLGDLGTSFVAGIAIFSTLGAMSLAANVPVPEVIGESGTVGMSFMAFPYALAQLPYSAVFALIFFFALITLGIDSAFSITESVLASIVDKTGWNRTAVLWGMTFIGFFAGVYYCSRGGLIWVEQIDGFINGPWGIALLGLVECLVLGWMYRISRLREHANERSDWRLGAWWDWNIRLLVPIVLSALFIWSLFDTVTQPGYIRGAAGAWNVPSIVALGLAGLAPVVAVLLSLLPSKSRSPAETRHLPLGEGQRATGLSIFGCAAAGLALVAAIGATVLVVDHEISLRETVAPALAAEASPAYKADALAAMDILMHPTSEILLAVLGGTMLVAGVALVLGAIEVKSAESRRLRPHPLARLSGGIGAMATGLAGGLGLAMWTILRKAHGIRQQLQGGVQAPPVRVEEDLELMAYVMAAVMVMIIVVGLGLCFSLALKAAGGGDAEPQLSEAD